ncbi:MAG: hypothetical protein AMXMBFR76_05970 [Pseudomonadota bacterium]
MPARADALKTEQRLGRAITDCACVHTAHPLAKARALDGFNPVADGNDDVEVVVFNLAGDGASTLGLNLCKFCTGCLRLQLPLPESVAMCLVTTDRSRPNSRAI